MIVYPMTLLRMAVQEHEKHRHPYGVADMDVSKDEGDWLLGIGTAVGRLIQRACMSDRAARLL